MVTNYLFVKKIFLSVQCMHYKLMKLNFAMFFSTFVELMVVSNLGKNLLSFGAKTEYWSVTLLPLPKLRAVSNMLS